MRERPTTAYLVAVVYFLLLSDREHASGTPLAATDECLTNNNKCISGFQTSTLFVLISVALTIIPMLFCCYKATKRQPQGSEGDESKSHQPPHVYEEIDDNVKMKTPPAKSIIKRVPSEDEEKGINSDRYQLEQAPQLPERGYLTDIDFVAQEFDLILCRPPDIPQRQESFTKSTSMTVSGTYTPQSEVAKTELEKEASIKRGKTPSAVGTNQYNLTVPNKIKHAVKEQVEIRGGQRVKVQTRPVTYKKPQPYQTPILKGNESKKVKDRVVFTRGQPLPQNVQLHTTTTGRQNKRSKQQHTLEKRTLRPSSHDSRNLQAGPVYQNVPDDVKLALQQSMSYENTTVNGQQLAEDKKSNASGQTRGKLHEDNPRSHYQPLLIVHESDDEEYMDINMH